MTFSEYVERFGAEHDLKLTIQQALACHYLERAGQRFLIDFGYDNAIQEARELRQKKNRERIFS